MNKRNEWVFLSKISIIKYLRWKKKFPIRESNPGLVGATQLRL